MSGPHDVVVIGGGLAGASTAFHLARAGHDVALVEREGNPSDKVCGEFLSFEALHYLRRLDIDPLALGGTAIDTLGVAFGPAPVVRRPLAFPAASLSRRRLDEALLTRAAAAGAVLRRGQAVRGLDRRHGIWVARLADGEEIEAREAVVATGKHDLRDRPRPPGRQNDLIGFKLHYRLEAAQTAELARRVELFAFDSGYGGLEPVEENLANLCLLVRRSRFAELGGRCEALLSHILADCPHLGRRLRHAVPVRDKPLAIASIPYGFVRHGPCDAFHVGDQGAVIPSFCGEGMSIALHSGELAAAYLIAGRSAAEFQDRLAADVSRQVRLATALSRTLTATPVGPLMQAGLRFLPQSLHVIAKATRLSPAALCTAPMPYGGDEVV